MTENETTQSSAVEELAQDPSSRKRFLKAVGGTGAAAALGVLIAACGGDDEETGSGSSSSSTTSETKTTETSMDDMGGMDMAGDVDILNYALTLEYLEAQFYADVIASGVITDKTIGAVAQKFGESEQEHVDAIIATVEKLGGKPSPKPNASFQSVIDGGAKMILETAATVENLGAAAYLNEAPKIKNAEVLAAALAIHSVEARHAAALNAVVGRGFMGDGPLSGSIPDGAFAKPMDRDAVLKAVQPFLKA